MDDLKKGRLQQIKKASFTVEAAVLVPVAAMIVAVLIGYIYFMHNTVCAYGAAVEALFYAEQCIGEDDDRSSRLEERLGTRSLEMPIEEFSYKGDTGNRHTEAEVSDSLLKGVFGELFSYRHSVRLEHNRPAGLKRLQWIAKHAADSADND